MISLVKGQKIELSKNYPDLSSLTIGLGWSTKASSIDLDASAFLLGRNGKILSEDDFVFYNNLSDTSGCVVHMGDSLEGSSGKDDEQLQVQLDRAPNVLQRIVFTVTIHNEDNKNHNFGEISNAYIRILNDETAEEIIRFDLKNEYSLETAIVVAELYKKDNTWRFAAIGSGFNGGLEALCNAYGLEVAEEDSSQNEPPSNLKPQSSKIDLLKKKVDVVLEKKNIKNIICRVGLVLDISGSMFRLYKSGIVQEVLDRMVAVSSSLDDNGVLDMWMFDHRFKRLPSTTISNCDNYINREILDKFSRKEMFGANNEPPVMEDVVKKYTIEEKSELPNLIIFISDGGVHKTADIKRIVINSSREPIFWQFVGLGNANYGILKKLDTLKGRFVDNANFFSVDDISKISDEELYDRLLNEFPLWLREAKNKGIL